MPLPFLTLIPTIFSALSSAPELISAGQDLIKSVTGKPSKAKSAEDLNAEISKLPIEQQEEWAKGMSARIKQYEAETGRLVAEQGNVTADVLQSLPPEAAAEVAVMRMTTRPWVVRLMARAMAWPIMFLFVVDGVLALLNSILATFGTTDDAGNLVQFQLIAGQFFEGNTVYAQMYGDLVGPAAAIVMTFMTLCQFEKKKGDANPVNGIAAGLKGLAGMITRIRS